MMGSESAWHWECAEGEELPFHDPRGNFVHVARWLGGEWVPVHSCAPPPDPRAYVVNAVMGRWAK